MVRPGLGPSSESQHVSSRGDIGEFLSAALAGDSSAFECLTEPYRPELLAHCYRMLGSIQDAEDLVQETFLRAWRRLATYEGRASLRSWLYKIATNACLDALAQRPRRSLPQALVPPSGSLKSIPAPVREPVWLEPFPDELLPAGETFLLPEARVERRESVSLSFLLALQLLPPRQRCVLILADVLDWSPGELADLLETSQSSVNSLLHRARFTMRKNYRSQDRPPMSSRPADQATKTLLDRYVNAWESANMDEIVALLRRDAVFAMPPYPLWVQGREAIREFIAAVILHGEARGRWRLLPLQANGNPAFAWYQKNEEKQIYQAFAIQVLGVQAGRFSELITFAQPELFGFFKLASELALA